MLVLPLECLSPLTFTLLSQLGILLGLVPSFRRFWSFFYEKTVQKSSKVRNISSYSLGNCKGKERETLTSMPGHPC